MGKVRRFEVLQNRSRKYKDKRGRRENKIIYEFGYVDLLWIAIDWIVLYIYIFLSQKNSIYKIPVRGSDSSRLLKPK